MDAITPDAPGNTDRSSDRSELEKRLEDHVLVIRTWVLAAIATGVASYVLWSAFFIPQLGWRAGDLAIGGVLVGFGSCAVGATLGFLFGTPRTLQEGVGINNGRPKLFVNTALEEISSWLTKIIVGISLINAAEFASYFWSFVQKCAYMGDAVPAQTVVLAGLIVYAAAAVVGFVGMYLFTRTYLSVVLNLASRTT